MSIEAILRSIIAEQAESNGWDDEPQCSDKEYIENLMNMYEKFCEQHEFKPGDLIVQKKGVGSHYRYSGKKYPCVVISMLNPTRYAASEMTAYQNEIHDLEVGMIIDGDFERSSVNSRWFEPYKQS